MRSFVVFFLIVMLGGELVAQNEQIYHVDFKVKDSQYKVYDRSGTDGLRSSWIYQDGKLAISNKTIQFGTGDVVLNQDDWVVCGPFDLTQIENGGFLKFITSREWGSNKLSAHVSKTFNPAAPDFSAITWREVSIESDFPPNSIAGVSDINHYDAGTYNISSRELSLYRFRTSSNAYVAIKYVCNQSGTHTFDLHDLEIVGNPLNNSPYISGQENKIQVEKGNEITLTLSNLMLQNIQEGQSVVLKVLNGNGYTFDGNHVLPDVGFEGVLDIQVEVSVDGVATVPFVMVAEVIDDINATKLKEVQTRIARLLPVENDISLEEALTTQWAGDGSFLDVNDSDMRRQALYGRMAAMANAWFKQEPLVTTGKTFAPEEIKEMTYRALLHYCLNPASYNFPNGAFTDPEYFGGIAVLLFDAMQEDKTDPALSSLISDLSTALFDLNKNVYLSGGTVDESILLQNEGDGGLFDHQRQGNLGYRLKGMLAACVGTGRKESMDWLANHCQLQVPLIINKAGFHPVGNSIDGSLFQHNGGGSQVYWSGYGVNWTLAMLGYQESTANTPWEYPQKDLDATADMFANGMVWGYYKGHFPFNISGRGQASSGSNLGWESFIIKQCAYLANATKQSSASILNEHIRAVRENASLRTHLVDSAKYFHNGEFMIHRTANVQYCVKMLSNRSAGPESSSEMNKTGFLLGDGSTFINRGALDHQFSRPIWNWQAIPGVTAEQRSFPSAYNDRYLAEWGRRGNSLNSFAGGLTNGRAGVCGFEYRRAYDETYDYYPVEAEKGYFFMGDNMVVLGAGINRRNESGTGADIWTTIEQKDFGDKFIASVGSEKYTILRDFLTGTTEYVKSSDQPIWFWHDNIGYIVYPRNGETVEVVFGVKQESGNWHDLSDGNSDELVESEVLYMAINHQAFPDQANCNYIVLGNVSEAEMIALVTDPGFEVIQNDSQVQAISWNNGQYLQAVFYSPASVLLGNGRSLSVDKPAVIMLEKDDANDYVLQVSDPLQVEGNTITIGIDGAYSSNTWASLQLNGITTIPIVMPVGNYIGASLSGDLKADGATKIIDPIGADKQTLNVFPNPVSNGFVNVQARGVEEEITMRIIDIAGKVVGKQLLIFPRGEGKCTIALHQLKKGSYVFSFQTPSGKEEHKILVLE